MNVSSNRNYIISSYISTKHTCTCHTYRVNVHDQFGVLIKKVVKTTSYRYQFTFLETDIISLDAAPYAFLTNIFNDNNVAVLLLKGTNYKTDHHCHLREQVYMRDIHFYAYHYFQLQQKARCPQRQNHFPVLSLWLGDSTNPNILIAYSQLIKYKTPLTTN